MHKIPNKLDLIIHNACVQAKVPFDWRLYKAQLWQESKFNPLARSPVGAEGVAQFMPATWAEWLKKLNLPPDTPRTNTEMSVLLGAHYMNYLWNEWHSPRPDIDRFCLAAASYNSGLGDILKAQKQVGGAVLWSEIAKGLPIVEPKHAPETLNYVEKILDFYTTLVIMG